MNIEIFGESHGPCIGGVITNLPAGIKLDYEKIQKDMDKRRPGKDNISTSRNEADKFEIVSGVLNETTTGAPLTVIIKNSDTHSSDYSDVKFVPRPNHSDYAAYVKYGGFNDIRGGGHFSGRLTAPLVCIGAICKQILEKKNITVKAHIYNVGNVYDTPMGMEIPDLKEDFPVINPEKESEIKEIILDAKNNLDSVGGAVECGVFGLEAGYGGPFLDGLEGEIARMLFGIPGVKGVDFGIGFDFAKSRGSEVNDGFTVKDGKVETLTNNCGGILGGISNGMPIIVKAAFKPTPSISQKQKSVDLTTMTASELEIHGRHDPCIAVRAVPVVEAVMAIAVVKILNNGR